MAEEELIDRTVEKLGEIVPMPKQCERYLKRPPVGFVHYLVMEVIKATGFAEGLYAAEEQDCVCLVNRQAKMRFVQKAVVCVALALGEDLDVSATRLLAGQEAMQTNMWLQKLHYAATTCTRARSSEAVDRTLQLEQVGALFAGLGSSPTHSNPASTASSASGSGAGMGARSGSRTRLDEARSFASDGPCSPLGQAVRPASTKSRFSLTSPFPLTGAARGPLGAAAAQREPADLYEEDHYVVSGCVHEHLGRRLRGTYRIDEENHGRDTYRKEHGQTDDVVHIYFWQDEDDEVFTGWWLSPQVGADTGWGFNPSLSEAPPATGWKVPWNDTSVDESIKVVRAKASTSLPSDASWASDLGSVAARSPQADPAAPFNASACSPSNSRRRQNSATLSEEQLACSRDEAGSAAEAAAEVDRAEGRRLLVSCEQRCLELQDKLAAAEDRIRELEEQKG